MFTGLRQVLYCEPMNYPMNLETMSVRASQVDPPDEQAGPWFQVPFEPAGRFNWWSDAVAESPTTWADPTRTSRLLWTALDDPLPAAPFLVRARIDGPTTVSGEAIRRRRYD